jgi:hypothetical protein
MTTTAAFQTFDYETGEGYLDEQKQARLQQQRQKHATPDPRYTRSVEEVAMIYHPLYRQPEKHTRWLAALGRGKSYEFYLFPGQGMQPFLKHVRASPRRPHWFAVAEEKRPIHFYLDIEEEPADGLARGTALEFFQQRARPALWFIQAALEALYGVSLEYRKPKQRWLCASDSKKHSFHLHVNQWTWEGVEELCGAMEKVRQALDALRAAQPQHWLVQALLSCNPNKTNPWIVDFSVYTPRRKFRMAFQTKPGSSRVLLPWLEDHLMPVEQRNAALERWLRYTCLMPRKFYKHPLLPSVETARLLHQELCELCAQDGSVQKLQQAIRIAYYDGSDGVAVARLEEPSGLHSRWALAQRMLWHSGARRLHDPVLFHWQEQALQLPQSDKQDTESSLLDQFQLAGWFLLREQQPLCDPAVPGASPYQQCQYRALCVRLLYRLDHLKQTQGRWDLLPQRYTRLMLQEDGLSDYETEQRRKEGRTMETIADWTAERERLMREVLPAARVWFAQWTNLVVPSGVSFSSPASIDAPVQQQQQQPTSANSLHTIFRKRTRFAFETPHNCLPTLPPQQQQQQHAQQPH